MNFEVSNLKTFALEKAEVQLKKLGLRSSHCRTDYRVVVGRLRGELNHSLSSMPLFCNVVVSVIKF